MSIDEPDGHDGPNDVVRRRSLYPARPSTEQVRRVVVVDDHELLRAGTCRILDDSTGFTVVGEAGDGAEALRVIADAKPDVVLVDIRLPTGNGIDLSRQIVRDFPDHHRAHPQCIR